MILKNLLAVGTFTSLMFAASAFVLKEEIKKPDPGFPSENNGLAVLELFTSEGCSSCPPADELIGQIEKEYRNRPVYILSYHVDYWNRLGWKDRFSSAANSQRQQFYSRLLQSQTYTPQLVVNGKEEFVGSDRNSIENALQNAFLDAKHSSVHLSANVSHKTVTIGYKTSETDPKSSLLISLVEKKSSTKVGGGENEGHHLQHWQIVHEQKQVSLKDLSEGSINFKIPENFSAENWEIIAFIQHLKTGKISGAGKAFIH